MTLDFYGDLGCGETLNSLYKNKKKNYDELSIPMGTQEKYLEEGWTIKKEYKTKVRIVKEKSSSAYFEDLVWCLLYRLGFEEMNIDDQFKISISKKGLNPTQIDVYARDENTAIVVECECAEKPTKKSFLEVINTINGMRENIINSINNHYNLSKDSKLKIGFIIATKNIMWSDFDLNLASTHSIAVLRDEEIDYYKEIAAHIGSVAKYQLLAEVFPDKKISGLKIKVPAIQGQLGKMTFYSFVIEPSKLLPLASVAHRMKADKDTLITYQRMLDKKRLDAIRDFINEGDGLFPNSIILNFNTGKKGLLFEPTGAQIEDTSARIGHLHLPPLYKTAWIIDGQHRLYGFSESEKADKVTIPVVAFENLQAEVQANMFVDINSKQKKVPTNLLQDLYSDLWWGSSIPEHSLRALNSKISSGLGKELSSPLYNMIKPSTAKSSDKPITLTTLTSALNKTQLVGSVNKGGKNIRPGPLYSDTKNNLEDTLRKSHKFLSDYFDVFKNGVPANWEVGSEDGGYLCTNNGIVALFFLLKEVITHIEKATQIQGTDLSADELMNKVKKYLIPVTDYFKNASYDDIMSYRRQYGAAGQKNCAYGMMEKINIRYKDFNPPGLEKYLIEQKSTWNEEARATVPELQLIISKAVLSQLESDFKDNWWYGGVPDKVRKAIITRQDDDPEHEPKENYFDLMHYYKIISKSSNWLCFKDRFGLTKYGKKKDEQLSWFMELNRLRNKVAHPERGKVTEEEIAFLRDLKKELETNLKEGQ